jgi:hypothetical protein
MKEYHCLGNCCGDVRAMPHSDTIETKEDILTAVDFDTHLFDGMKPKDQQASCLLNAKDGTAVVGKCILRCTRTEEQESRATNVRELHPPRSTHQHPEARELLHAK